MFDHVGRNRISTAKAASDDAMMEAAIEAGAEDVASTPMATKSSRRWKIWSRCTKALEAKFGEPTKSKLVWRPQNTVAVDDEAGEKIFRLIGALEDNDDVQNVYANFEISDALMAKLGG